MSQVLFVAAVGLAGASRTSVVVGTAPLVAGLIARLAYELWHARTA
jgi:hypothetical protein